MSEDTQQVHDDPPWGAWGPAGEGREIFLFIASWWMSHRRNICCHVRETVQGWLVPYQDKFKRWLRLALIWFKDLSVTPVAGLLSSSSKLLKCWKSSCTNTSNPSSWRSWPTLPLALYHIDRDPPFDRSHGHLVRLGVLVVPYKSWASSAKIFNTKISTLYKSLFLIQVFDSIFYTWHCWSTSALTRTSKASDSTWTTAVSSGSRGRCALLAVVIGRNWWFLLKKTIVLSSDSRKRL